MVGIKFILQDMNSKEKKETTQLFFPEWTEEVRLLVEINREAFKKSLPNCKVLAVIVNEDNV